MTAHEKKDAIVSEEAKVSEKHTVSFDYFDVVIEVTDQGDVNVGFRFVDDVPANVTTSMDFDTFREIIDVVGRFGLGMKEPYLVEYADTVEAAEKVAS